MRVDNQAVRVAVAVGTLGGVTAVSAALFRKYTRWIIPLGAGGTTVAGVAVWKTGESRQAVAADPPQVAAARAIEEVATALESGSLSQLWEHREFLREHRATIEEPLANRLEDLASDHRLIPHREYVIKCCLGEVDAESQLVGHHPDKHPQLLHQRIAARRCDWFLSANWSCYKEGGRLAEAIEQIACIHAENNGSFTSLMGIVAALEEWFYPMHLEEWLNPAPGECSWERSTLQSQTGPISDTSTCLRADATGWSSDQYEKALRVIAPMLPELVTVGEMGWKSRYNILEHLLNGVEGHTGLGLSNRCSSLIGELANEQNWLLFAWHLVEKSQCESDWDPFFEGFGSAPHVLRMIDAFDQVWSVKGCAEVEWLHGLAQPLSSSLYRDLYEEDVLQACCKTQMPNTCLSRKWELFYTIARRNIDRDRARVEDIAREWGIFEEIRPHLDASDWDQILMIVKRKKGRIA